MRAIRTWVVVADARRATVFENTGRGTGLRELENMRFEADLLPEREIMSDKPGRSFESVGSARHAMERPSDPHREEKRKFARRLAGILRESQLANRYDRLVIAAPPATMGDLRALLPEQVKDVLQAEIVADLTKIPANELPAHLESHPAFNTGAFSAAGRPQG